MVGSALGLFLSQTGGLVLPPGILVRESREEEGPRFQRPVQAGVSFVLSFSAPERFTHLARKRLEISSH